MAFLTQGSMALGVDTFSEIQPKRFALDYQNSALIMEYLVPGTGKLYLHKMRIRESLLSTPAEHIYNSLRKKHSTYLDPRQVSADQVIDLITKLQLFKSTEEIIL
jgi:hypothetical protein